MNSELQALLNAIQTDLQEMWENHIYEFKCGRVSCVTLLFGRYLLHKLKKTYYVLPSVIPYHTRSTIFLLTPLLNFSKPDHHRQLHLSYILFMPTSLFRRESRQQLCFRVGWYEHMGFFSLGQVFFVDLPRLSQCLSVTHLLKVNILVLCVHSLIQFFTVHVFAISLRYVGSVSLRSLNNLLLQCAVLCI